MLIAIVGGVVWLFIKIFFIGWEVEADTSASPPTPQPARSTSRGGASRVIVDVPKNPLSLIISDGVTCPVVGTTHWTTLEEKRAFTGDKFYLRREPTNAHDKNAIAVYAGMQKFGYLSAPMAARYAPMLDQIGGEFLVKRDLTTQKMALIMPKVGDLRKIIPAGQSN